MTQRDCGDSSERSVSGEEKDKPSGGEAEEAINKGRCTRDRERQIGTRRGKQEQQASCQRVDPSDAGRLCSAEGAETSDKCS